MTFPGKGIDHQISMEATIALGQMVSDRNIIKFFLLWPCYCTVHLLVVIHSMLSCFRGSDGLCRFFLIRSLQHYPWCLIFKRRGLWHGIPFRHMKLSFFLLNDLRWEVLGLVLSSIYSNSWLVSQGIGHTFDNRHPNDSDQFWLKLVLCRGFRWEDFWKGLPQSYILLSRYLGI